MIRMIRAFSVAGVATAVLFLAVWSVHGGGWAVVTVDDLPDYVVAGEPFTLDFSVRQHGMHLTEAPGARVVATNGRREITVPAAAGQSVGYYSSTITLPDPGDWTLTIRGWQEMTLLPIEAVTPGRPAPPPAEARERGRRLFVAKGCIGCHAHEGVDRPVLYRAGPEHTSARELRPDGTLDRSPDPQPG